MNDLAQLEVSGRIATLSLNRPEARNALSLDLLAALHTHVDELTRRTDLTVLILTGRGKSFCSGMDLKAVLDDPAAPSQLLHSLADFTLKLRGLPQVSLAQVNGSAIGGGCGLACVCDMAITHADSKVGYPEVDFGVCPAVVAPWLVKKIGAGPARRVLLSGGLMPGQRAFELGMVDHVVPTLEELPAATLALATKLATGGPHALRATKNLLNQLDDSANAAIIKRGADLSAQVVGMEETKALLRGKMAK